MNWLLSMMKLETRQLMARIKTMISNNKTIKAYYGSIYETKIGVYK